MCLRMPVVAVILALANWLTPAFAQAPKKLVTMPPAPSKSLPTPQVTGRVTRSFSAQGIEAVYLRAEAAEEAEVRTIPGSRRVTVSGVPAGGAAGYHPPDPNWRETPAALWGLGFVARPFGSALVISSEKELRYIHHHYHLEKIVIEVPPEVKVIREKRQISEKPLSGPDLSAPNREKS